MAILACTILLVKLSGAAMGPELCWLDILQRVKMTLAPEKNFSPSAVLLVEIPSYQELARTKKTYANIENVYGKIVDRLSAGGCRVIVADRQIPLTPAENVIQVLPVAADGAAETVRKDVRYGFFRIDQPTPVRTVLPFAELSEGRFVHAALEAVGRYRKESPQFEKSRLLLGDKEIPLNKGRILLTYVAGGEGGYYESVSMETLLKTGGDYSEKIVLLAPARSSETVFQKTPAGMLTEPQLLAQMIYSLREKQQIRHIGPLRYFFLTILLMLLSQFLFPKTGLKALPYFCYAALCAVFLFALYFFIAAVYTDIIPMFLKFGMLVVMNRHMSRRELQEQIEYNVKTYGNIIEKSLKGDDVDDWGYALLNIICKPLELDRGLLMLSAGEEAGKKVFYYPKETYRASGEEIGELETLTKPALARRTLALPLQGENGIKYGVLKLQKMHFSAGELRQLAALSQIAIISINNRQLMERMKNTKRLEIEAELAGKIQKSLLTDRAPEVRGTQIACRCVPASEVGGDYFDFVTTPGGSIGIACGDVTGHGMAAALIMGLLRSVVRSQGGQMEATNEVVEATNNILYKDFKSFSKMASLFYCTYSPTDKTLSFTNAGHNPPFIIRAAEMGSRPLKGKGPILGFRQNIRYKEFRTKIYPKDIIVFMTDGIVEAENAEKEFFGTERLEAVVNNHVDGSAQEILDAVFRAVTEFTEGVEQKDDMTLVIMKV